MTVQAMKAGAVEFLTKPFRDDVAAGRCPTGHRTEPRRTRLSAEMQRCADCTRRSAGANGR
jgi:FixJ family two-component response regulator